MIESSTKLEIAKRRLINQRIAGDKFSKPEDVVNWLGAVQSQDYYGAQWSLGLRLQNAEVSQIELALAEGRILRTHLLRPTWHFVTPADIRWLLKLTAPRVTAASAYMHRKHGLDQELFQRSNDVIEKTLRGGTPLTRDELADALTQAGMDVSDGNRLSYFMMNAELEGLICSGPRRGKQFTYLLLEEYVPSAQELSREASLAELARRYFTSRGPATLQDFAKWSGLTMEDCKIGVESIRSNLVSENAGSQTYWFSTITENLIKESPTAFLASIFDEYVSSYKDHDAVCTKEIQARLREMGNGLVNIIVMDGQIIGSWKRTLKAQSMVIELSPYVELSAVENEAVQLAAQAYADFFNYTKLIVQNNIQKP